MRGHLTVIFALRRRFASGSSLNALASIPDDPNVNWVTGLSKTADVEGFSFRESMGPACRGACCFEFFVAASMRPAMTGSRFLFLLQVQ